MVSATSPERPAVCFDGPLHLDKLSTISALRAVLERHGFIGNAVVTALGSALPLGKSHMRDDMPLYLRRVAAPTPINTLVKLFVLDRSVDESRAAAALAPLDLDDLVELGLIEHGPRGVKATLRLSVHEGLVLAHDAYDEARKTLRPDHVLDVNPTTMTLSHLTVRRQVASALEIGTGCGVLALLASRHAGRVVATDTNARALNLASFNAAINGIANVEWRLTSLFDGLDGERFDLVFCNPPYVISPDSQYIFRDGGRRGDTLCEEIVRRVPEFLNHGGFATVLINWAIRKQQEWHAPLTRWVEGNGCDSWLMLSAAQDPETYAAIWNRSRDRETYAAGLDRWMRYFDELDLQAIGLGAVVLRRSDASWIRADQVPDSVTAAAGAHIERLFAAEDWLAAVGDDSGLLAQRLRVVPDHIIEQSLSPSAGGGYEIAGAEARLQGGLPFRGSVDAYTIQLLAHCDGTRTLADAAATVAAMGKVDRDTFTAASAGIARRLIKSGFLVP